MSAPAVIIKDSVKNDTITKGAIINGAIHKGNFTKGNVAKDTVTKDSTTREAVIRGAITNSAVTKGIDTKDTTANCPVINDSVTDNENSNDDTPLGIVLELEDGTKITSSDPEYPLINRIVALKNLQMDTLEVEQEFHKELHKVHANYLIKMQNLCKKRQRIIDGSFFPPPTFGQYRLVIQKEIRLKDKYHYEKLQYFWLIVLSQFSLIEELIKPADIPILGYLNDICVGFDGEDYFTIEFHFDPNDYFANSVLMKRYYEVIEIDKAEPFQFDGPEIYRSEGCPIYWKKNKNITREKFIEPGNSNISDMSAPNYTKVESFFHFFDPPQFPLVKTVVDMELERTLTIDFEIGNILRNKIIPHAIPIYLNALEEMHEEDD